MATSTPPAAWLGESDEMLATVLDIFRLRAEAMKTKGRHRG